MTTQLDTSLNKISSIDTPLVEVDTFQAATDSLLNQIQELQDLFNEYKNRPE